MTEIVTSESCTPSRFSANKMWKSSWSSLAGQSTLGLGFFVFLGAVHSELGKHALGFGAQELVFLALRELLERAQLEL